MTFLFTYSYIPGSVSLYNSLCCPIFENHLYENVQNKNCCEMPIENLIIFLFSSEQLTLVLKKRIAGLLHMI